ncbi:hypothetical protein COV20_01075 [Candidatus Woesearchaeota archaeon CG10_big_fil_rev_8_21_14_0_10_45_16]|nr:MAG: hypothetical protein COV20_01075 [Candidatus Woesearchaeota archaeon CG10_big_fil_rev_8_21_14_0_10_45_16]
MKYLQKGLDDVLEAFRNKKKFLLILIVLQITIIVWPALLVPSYQLQAIQYSQDIVASVQTANYDTAQLQEGQPFIQDYLPLYKSAQGLKQLLLKASSWALFFFLVINGLIWTSTMQIFEKISWRSALRQFSRYLATTSILILIWIIFSTYYFYRQWSIESATPETLFNIIGIAALVLYYFFLTAAACINSPWKKLPKRIFTISVKNIHKVAVLLAINGAVLFLPLYLTYKEIEADSGFMLFTLLLFILAVVVTRLYWIAAIRHLE